MGFEDGVEQSLRRPYHWSTTRHNKKQHNVAQQNECLTALPELELQSSSTDRDGHVRPRFKGTVAGLARYPGVPYRSNGISSLDGLSTVQRWGRFL